MLLEVVGETGGFVMRKEMKRDCFSPSALSTQLILLGGQISAVPGEEEEEEEEEVGEAEGGGAENESDQSETK